MGVKTIFKVLIGTIFMVVLTAVIIEMVNINLVGYQVNQLSRLSFKLACEYFSQETYKREDAFLGNMPPIKDKNGYEVITGTFYNGETTNAVYDNLYKNNPKFKNWALQRQGIWQDLDRLLIGMGLTGGGGAEQAAGEFYYTSRMTPLNLNITYLDEEAVEKIARWHIGKIFSTGNPHNANASSSRPYVKFKGFRIYPQEVVLNKIEYEEINIIDEPDKFTEITGINPSGLTQDGSGDERAIVSIASLEFTVPVAYEGVTPLKQIIRFGLSFLRDEVPPQVGDGVLDESVYDNSGLRITPVTNKLYYYVIR